MWLTVILGIWLIWGLVWGALWLWTDRTDVRAPAATQAPYRLINIAAFVALFGDGAWRHGHWTPLLPSLWHVPPALGWLMAALAAAGLLLALSARATLGRLWSAAVTRKAGHRIVDTGPYALVRHPIYTALLMGGTAVAVAKGTPIALAGLALMAIGYVLKARVEERFLAAELGERAYAAYRSRVPMLIPFAPPARD